MPSGKKRKRQKMSTHKRKKRLRKMPQDKVSVVDLFRQLIKWWVEFVARPAVSTAWVSAGKPKCIGERRVK